jgi:hypothetical protein
MLRTASSLNPLRAFVMALRGKESLPAPATSYTAAWYYMTSSFSVRDARLSQQFARSFAGQLWLVAWPLSV